MKHETMTRRLPISQHQITAICKGAAKAGFVAEIEINGIKILLRPQMAADNRDDYHEEDFRFAPAESLKARKCGTRLSGAP